MNSKNCLNCLRDFTKDRFTSKKEWIERKFCSKKCADNFKRGKSFKHNKQFKKGLIPWNKGKKNPVSSERMKNYNPMKRIEVRERSSLSHIGKMVGELSPNWKGGKTSKNGIIRKSFEYKKWRSNVFQRDNWTCQTCRIRGIELEAHHIKSFAHHPELRFDMNNGITLCRECHNLTKKTD